MRAGAWLGLVLGAACLMAAPATAQGRAGSGRADPELSRAVAAAFDALRPAVEIAGRAPVHISLADLMQRHNVPAVSIAIIRDGRIAWAGAFGTADAASGRAASADTLFQAGSISKPVAATAALVLVQQGRLRLDEAANAQLRSWRIPDGEAAPGDAVTLRHLLTHTGGLTVSGFEGYARNASVPTLTQVLDGAAPANSQPVRIAAVPGTAWRYSGGGYSVAQQLLVDAGGRAFPELMDRLVLRPTGMTRSTYRQRAGAPPGPDIAAGHRRDGSAVAGGGYHLYPEMAAAGLWTTPSDVARWAIAIMAAFNGETGGVLQPATARAMLEKGPGDWGIGVGVEGEGEQFRFSHSGINEGYQALMMAYPARREGFVIMTNSDNGTNLFGPLHMTIAQLLGWQEVAPRMIQPVPIAAAQRDALAGTYANERLSVEVRVEGERIVATQRERGTFELIPVGEDRFEAPDARLLVRFTRDPATGRVTEMVAGGATLPRTS